jgi:hypothetical protein
MARFLAERGEIVIELDRPNRPARCNGAKSDPFDAVRAAREALLAGIWPSLVPVVNAPRWRPA